MFKTIKSSITYIFEGLIQAGTVLSYFSNTTAQSVLHYETGFIVHKNQVWPCKPNEISFYQLLIFNLLTNLKSRTLPNKNFQF